MKKNTLLLSLLSTFLILDFTQCLEQPDNIQAPNKTNNLNNNFGLPENSRQQITELLNKLLANEYVLYTKTLGFHWNIKGKHFGPLHKLFKQHYEKLLEISDLVAERCVQFGFKTDGTLQVFLSKTSLSEQSEQISGDISMIATLLHDHEIIIKQLHEIIDITDNLSDHGTSNMLSEIIEKHEKMAWMLRAHLE